MTRLVISGRQGWTSSSDAPNQTIPLRKVWGWEGVLTSQGLYTCLKQFKKPSRLWDVRTDTYDDRRVECLSGHKRLSRDGPIPRNTPSGSPEAFVMSLPASELQKWANAKKYTSIVWEKHYHWDWTTGLEWTVCAELNMINHRRVFVLPKYFRRQK